MTDSQQDQPTQENSERELSQLVKDYLAEYRAGLDYENQPVANPIQADELASKVARIYEKVRRIIDWKEENLVRRTAIERILKRSLLSELSGIGFTGGLEAEKITEPLIMEMIRSGYFGSGRVSRNKIPVAKKSLSKYIYILNNSPYTQEQSLKIKDKVNFYNWVLEIAACELEEILEPAFKENALINLMTSSVYQKLLIKPAGKMTKQEQLIQTYIAVHRTLFGLDDPIITYNLIKYRYPRWIEDDEQFLNQFTNNIEQIKKELEQDLEHPHAPEFFKICERYDAAYLVLGDAMKEIEQESKKIEDKMKNTEGFMEIIEKVYQQRVKTLKKRLGRSAVYSTLSIFAAGIVSFLIFEGPVAKLVKGHFSWFALFVDLAVPSALMFLLVIIIRPPKEENLSRLKEEVKKIVYPLAESEEYEVSLEKKRNWFIRGIFSLISLIAGSAAAYGIYWVFKISGVPWTSIYIDTVNVAMVIFAAMLIRHKSKEMTVEERGSVLNMLVDLVSIPLARVGQWFAQVWKEYNILSVFFTALVDTPFSVLLGLIEDWRSFLRDKRSEIH